MGPFLVLEWQQHVPVSRVSVSGVFLRTGWAGSVHTALSRVRSYWSPQSGFRRVQQLSRFSDALTSFAVPRLWGHRQSRGFLGRIVWSCSVVVCLVPCHLGWVDMQLDLVLRWHVGLLCVGRCSLPKTASVGVQSMNQASSSSVSSVPGQKRKIIGNKK